MRERHKFHAGLSFAAGGAVLLACVAAVMFARPTGASSHGPGSNCCEPHGAAGCDDPDCEAAVCAIEPFCCDFEFGGWDLVCAGLANGICDVCAPGPGTCQGFCGGNSDTGCWCDDACAEFIDCCPDVCDACPDLAHCGGPLEQTCAGSCGGQSPDGCWCDEDCLKLGDCCNDVCEECSCLLFCGTGVFGDLNGDGNVGVPDLLGLLSCWGPVTTGCECADLTENDTIGVSDLLTLLEHWGPGEPGEPRCTNCHAMADSVHECFHFANDPAGAPCQNNCIENILDTNTCDPNPDGTLASDCENRLSDPPAAEVVQRVRAMNCSLPPGSVVAWGVHWTIWRDDCGANCISNEYHVACVIPNCAGNVIAGPFPRGRRKVCECP